MAIPMPLAALIGREGGQNGFSFRDSFGGQNFSHKLSCNAVQLCHQSTKKWKNLVRECLLVDGKLFFCVKNIFGRVCLKKGRKVQNIIYFCLKIREPQNHIDFHLVFKKQ